jgi:hypothetical protein
MAGSQLSPDLEATISALFNYFLQYARTSSLGERATLEKQILSLFESLGATEHSSIIHARATFDEIRSEIQSRRARPRALATIARDFASNRIRIFESVPTNPKLSGPARELLRIPLAETTSRSGKLNQEQADESLGLILDSMRETPISDIEGDGKIRTSVAVIRAFAKNFCNIPPFCSGKTQ